MRVWLDDLREPPEGWVWVKTPTEAIRLLQTGGVEEISLDHDLALIKGDREETGYDVLLWIERAVAMHRFIPPRMHVHSANPVAQKRMLLTIDSITKISAERT